MHNNKEIPENSLLAFKKAINNNYVIELDVHLLKDGNIVVFHDDNLKRLTGINKRIKDTNIDYIKQLKLLETNEHIPTLQEVLKLVNGRVPIIIELKTDVYHTKLIKPVMKILETYKGKYAIKSFSPASIYYLKKKYPSVVRGQLSYDYKNKHMPLVLKYLLKNMMFNRFTKPDFISYGLNSLPNKKLEQIKNKIPVLIWTIKTKEDLKKAQLYGDNYICENILGDKND
jgi:glycerophosphoryl diester phosphodiesterase